MVDYKGQQLAEKLLVLVFVVVCAPAWVYGFLQQDFSYPFRAWLAATGLSALVGDAMRPNDNLEADCSFPVMMQLVLPNWGIYNRNPVKWLPSAMYVRKPKDKDAKPKTS